MQCSKPFANRRYTKGEPFLSDFIFSSGKGLDRGRGAEPPRVTPERSRLWYSVLSVACYFQSSAAPASI